MVKDDGAIVVSDVEAGSLKQRILMSSSEQEMAQNATVPPRNLPNRFFSIYSHFPWLNVKVRLTARVGYLKNKP